MQQSVNLWRFTAVYLLIAISLTILLIALYTLFGIELSSGLNMAAPMGATLDAGHQFFKKYQTIPSSSFAWKVTFKMTMIELVIGLAFVAVFAPTIFELDNETNLISLGSIFAGATIFAALIFWVAKRYFFTLSANHYQKVSIKQANNAPSN